MKRITSHSHTCSRTSLQSVTPSHTTSVGFYRHEGDRRGGGGGGCSGGELLTSRRLPTSSVSNNSVLNYINRNIYTQQHRAMLEGCKRSRSSLSSALAAATRGHLHGESGRPLSSELEGVLRQQPVEELPARRPPSAAPPGLQLHPRTYVHQGHGRPRHHPNHEARRSTRTHRYQATGQRQRVQAAIGREQDQAQINSRGPGVSEGERVLLRFWI